MSLKIIIITYIIICSLAFFFQRKLQHFPNKDLKEPAFYGLKNFNIQTLVGKNNLKITSWFKAPENDKKIIVYFHGNGDNLGNRSSRYDLFSQAGYGIMALSYQGYGASQGSPNQKGLMQNAQLVTDFLLKKGFGPEDMIFYGESMGSFVAVKHAVQINPHAVILEAPFYSMLEIAQKNYWYLPASLLLKDKFRSNKYADKIKSKTLIFHGSKDKVVPISSGKKLFQLFKSNKKFIEVENAGHIAIADKFLLDEMDKFLEDEELVK